MASDVEVALAFIARRQAVRAMSAARWCHLLSLELGWMNPGQARAFIDRGVRAGLLVPEGDLLRLLLDPQAVVVPRGFRPKPEAEAEPSGPGDARPGDKATAPAEPDLFLTWVARIAAHRAWTRDAVLLQVSELQGSMGGLLTGEAAVLLLARRSGLDVTAAANEAAATMLKPNRAGAPAPGRASTP